MFHCAWCGAATSATDERCPSCAQSPRVGAGIAFVRKLGSGRSGETWLGQMPDGAEVAVKAIALGDDDKRAFAEREARVLRELRHDRIPAFVDGFVDGRGRSATFFLVSELVDGTSIEAECRDRRYSEADVLAIASSVLEILVYLHGLSPPVIHRDLKPSNLLRRASDGRIVLIDFGVARDTLGTTHGTVAGTFGYMAPEQFRGEAGPATDLYGLGATMIALLSRKDPAELHDRQGRFQWEDRLAVSEPTRELLRRMVAPDPGQRPSAASTLDAVRAIRAGTASQPRNAPAKPGARAENGGSTNVVTASLWLAAFGLTVAYLLTAGAVAFMPGSSSVPALVSMLIGGLLVIRTGWNGPTVMRVLAGMSAIVAVLFGGVVGLFGVDLWTPIGALLVLMHVANRVGGHGYRRARRDGRRAGQRWIGQDLPTHQRESRREHERQRRTEQQ